MKRRANALRIGLFAIGGLALLVAAVVAVFGGKLFAHTERAVMYFDGSVYGLQVGAPVVFRGVRLGKVVSLGVMHDAATDAFLVPVVAEVDRSLIRDPQGRSAGTQAALSLPRLVQRGLRAQLLTQSLLTGQLYVDLDLAPVAATVSAATTTAAPTLPRATPADASPRSMAGLVEIPTATSGMQSLLGQLQRLDLGGMLSEITGAAASARQLANSPRLHKVLEEFAAAAATLARLAATLERRVGPLADAAQGTLADTRRAVGSVDGAADRVSAAADRVGTAAVRVDTLLAPGSPLLASAQRAADELARSAAALRQATAEDAPVMQNVERALHDVSRASRAVRELAELLERQPEALLRGRPVAP